MAEIANDSDNDIDVILNQVHQNHDQKTIIL